MNEQRKMALATARRRATVAAATALAALAIVTAAPAQAKQSCSTAAGTQGYWSWRIIDGRKCWYLGRPMVSKELLEWAAQGEVQDADARPAAASRNTLGDPMDAQASVPPERPATFDALWRQRIVQP